MACENLNLIISFIQLLDESLVNRAVVDTPLGAADIADGYDIVELQLYTSFLNATILTRSRSKKNNDLTRNGDRACFYVDNNNVYSESEYRKYREDLADVLCGL
jgi:hypothetical protein